MTPWPPDLRKENEEYLKSDRWKCQKSKTGAHHWIILNRTGQCKHCNLNKDYDTLRYWR